MDEWMELKLALLTQTNDTSVSNEKLTIINKTHIGNIISQHSGKVKINGN